MKEQYADTDAEFKPRALDPNFNLGTAINLLKLKDIAGPLGLSYKYNQEKKVWSPTIGLGFKTSFVNIGISAYREQAKESTDDVFQMTAKNDVITMTLGLKIKNFLLDYSKFSQMTQTEYVPLDPDQGLIASKSRYAIGTEIISGTFVWGGLNISYAVRKQDDSRALATSEGSVIESFGTKYKTKHELFGATYRFANILSVGYYHNYELESGNTVIAQLFIPVNF